MKYLELSIYELHDALVKGLVTPKELISTALKLAHEDDNNMFEYICDKEAYEQLLLLDKKDKSDLLWGIPFTIKDNFSTKNIPTCASSNILKGYVPVFSATVYDKLIEHGAICIGKTTLDEFAMGGMGKTGHLGKTYNPLDKTKTRTIGGSSCGSAASMAKHICTFSLGSDTGDSVRKPASYSGIVGMKPTWGRISRFGLFEFAASLDHVGYFTYTVRDSELLLNILAGHDDKDLTSSTKSSGDYTKAIPTLKGRKLCVIKEIFESITNRNIKNCFLSLINKLKDEGAIIDFVSLDINICKSIYPTYIFISNAEATSNTACFDGIRYGNAIEGNTYEETVFNTRTNGFSEPIKRRLIIGSFSLLKENCDDIFIKAQKCRRIIVNSINSFFVNYDGILLPATPGIAPKFDDKVNPMDDEYLIADNYLAIGNLAGLPSITVPLSSENGMPFGVNLTCKAFDEMALFSIAEGIEKVVKKYEF